MKSLLLLALLMVSWGLPFADVVSSAAAAEEREQRADTCSREVIFELTFANRDLIWLGDPGSPTAMLYPKPTARPIATDVHVRTLVKSHVSPGRRYLREARIVAEDHTRIVHAFTKLREKVIGTIDQQGRFTPNEFYKDNRELLPSWPADASVLAYDAAENALYYDVDVPGPQLTESLDFLPLELSDSSNHPVTGEYSIEYPPADQSAGSELPVISLMLKSGNASVTLAQATMPAVLRRADVQLGSFDNFAGTYTPESAYRVGAQGFAATEPSVTFAITGELTSATRSDGKTLLVADAPRAVDQPRRTPAEIIIDGNFDDWRNVTGVDDPRGDLVPYLEYNPDVDLLEFKVAHDEQHIYLYARVVGQVGRSAPRGGRSYFYAYMDVDRNPETGFLPTRDDDCYFGVDIGDDCEVQFEFVDSKFRKTFYGFCGLGGNENVLNQQVTIGKSRYARFDDDGVEAANYKSEYVYRKGKTEITEDLKRGSSDTIRLAVSPDGREVEVVSTFTGFLKDRAGRPTLEVGRTIDLAVGMECGNQVTRTKSLWGADSTSPIRGYQLRPASARRDGRE